MLRALRLLRDEGLLEMGRGRAIRVTETAEQGAVVDRVRELIRFARRQGYRPEGLIGLIERLSRAAGVRGDAAAGRPEPAGRAPRG